MIVPRALRANYDHQPRTDAVRHNKSKEESPRDATDTWVAACGRTTHLSKLGVNFYFEGFPAAASRPYPVKAPMLKQAAASLPKMARNGHWRDA
jgi:hypothetical protein